MTQYLINPEQFGLDLYHGTASKRGEMDMIDPGHASNYPDKTMDAGREHVFATTDMTQAYGHAANAANNKTDDFYQNIANKHGAGMAMKAARVYNPNAQAHVYPVLGTGNFSPDPEQVPRSMFGELNTMDKMQDEGVDAFQTKHPMTVTGPDIGADAKAEYHAEFGNEEAYNPDKRAATRMNWMENGESPVVTQANSLQRKQFG